MLQKTTTLSVLAILTAATGFETWSPAGGRPVGADGAGFAVASIGQEVRIDPRVSIGIAVPGAIAFPAAPGGAAPRVMNPFDAAPPAHVAVDEAVRPLVDRALRSVGPKRVARIDDRRGDVILRLLNGKVHAAIAAREPSTGERRRGVAEVRLGDLVVALVTHPDNPIGSLPSNALRDVMRGNITDWAQLGGRPGPIRLVMPQPGPQADLFARILVRGDTLPADTTAATDLDRMRLVANDPSALTVVSLESARRAQVAVLRIDGVPPSLGAHRVGRYPFGTPIVLVHRGVPAARALASSLQGEVAREALDYHLSLAGR